MTATATATRRTPLLTRALQADTVLTGGFAVILAAAATPLAGLLDLPEPLLRWAGIVLLPFTGYLAYLATRPAPPRRGVQAVIAVNVLWTVDSIALLFTGWVDPNPLGVAFVIAQALAVAGFAELHYTGLRRS
ncbi:hypothetical protein [Planomonospora venezuelensis]|uniref:Integral membrane protein n=1 Tax=Planomonospora venezuelensis TaxID=1999 RepID=A0A841CY37_PLAVE|nr:hypothetical protein [Planomonospora venezuelensis]MBB5960897.1 hypothetical protein [Planomonospora venezuelensis]GIN01132.1 hypothetical protein Pve01_27900 [Planomonospora venezuelensis]